MKQNKTWLPLKVGVLLLIGIMLILAGGFFSYQSLTSIVRKLHNKTTYDSGLPIIKDINNKIEKAENNIRLFGITKNRHYIHKYKQQISQVDSSLKSLHSFYPDDNWFNTKIDTITMLVDEKKDLYNELISIWKIDKTNENISSIIEAIETPKPDTVEKRFFERIFRSRKNEKPEIDKEIIINRIATLNSSKRQLDQRLIKKEIELSNSSNLISEAFISLMSQIEKYEKLKEAERASSAEQIAKQAYSFLALFSGVGTLLSILVLLLIVKYVHKNKAYNKMLASSRQEMQKMTKSKEQFMANVSHEIRTPLNAISGFVKQLIKSPLDDSVREKVEIVHSASEQLVSLINNVLDYTKLQAGKLPLVESHFDIANVLDNTCALFSEQAKQKTNTINFSVNNQHDLTLYGDYMRLKQILFNLISNAIKFTDNGSVNVIADVSPDKERAKLVIKVIDTGLGIDNSNLEEIFTEYTQENKQVALDYGGTGLGLSIVTRLVKLFDGEIDIKSEKGLGTTIFCNLYFKVGEKSKIRTKKEATQSFIFSKQIHCLVVDDERYNRKLITNLLNQWKITYDTANNGLEAIELINKKTYNLLLMDIRMPTINGIAAAKFIRETRKLDKEKLPVIGITASTPGELDEEVKHLFNYILTKPFDEDDLLEIIERCFSNKPPDKSVHKQTEVKSSSDADLSNLIRTAGGDMNFVKEMIIQFEESMLKGVEDLKAALEMNDSITIAELAHKLAPTSKHLGLKQLNSDLKKIEKLAKSKDIQNIDQLIDNVHKETISGKDALWNEFQNVLEN